MKCRPELQRVRPQERFRREPPTASGTRLLSGCCGWSCPACASRRLPDRLYDSDSQTGNATPRDSRSRADDAPGEGFWGGSESSLAGGAVPISAGLTEASASGMWPKQGRYFVFSNGDGRSPEALHEGDTARFAANHGASNGPSFGAETETAPIGDRKVPRFVTATARRLRTLLAGRQEQSPYPQCLHHYVALDMHSERDRCHLGRPSLGTAFAATASVPPGAGAEGSASMRDLAVSIALTRVSLCAARAPTSANFPASSSLRTSRASNLLSLRSMSAPGSPLRARPSPSRTAPRAWRPRDDSLSGSNRNSAWD